MVMLTLQVEREQCPLPTALAPLELPIPYQMLLHLDNSLDNQMDRQILAYEIRQHFRAFASCGRLWSCPSSSIFRWPRLCNLRNPWRELLGYIFVPGYAQCGHAYPSTGSADEENVEHQTRWVLRQVGIGELAVPSQVQGAHNWMRMSLVGVEGNLVAPGPGLALETWNCTDQMCVLTSL